MVVSFAWLGSLSRVRFDSIDTQCAEGIRPDAQRLVDWTKVLADTLGLVNRLHRYGEDVARAALGSDMAWPPRIALDLVVWTANLQVDRAVEDLVVVQP
jgi:hypothetical protein